MIMSKIGNWFLDMQEAAAELTKEQFIKKYGEANAEVWDDVHHPKDEPDYS
jgi:hypothetical protein